MSATVKLKTYEEAISAVWKAEKIYVRPDYGISQHWVTLEKGEACFLLRCNRDNRPKDLPGNIFGFFENDKYLFLGKL